MINGYAINSHALNTMAGETQEPIEPPEPIEPILPDGPAVPDTPVVVVPVVPPKPPRPPIPSSPPADGVYAGFDVPEPPEGHSYRWSAVVTVGGNDITSTLTGAVRVDREEGAAGLAEFAMYYPVGQPVDIDIENSSVTIDYITGDSVDAVQVRLFTGFIAEPSWDAARRVMTVTASDNLQQRVEAMEIAQIDALIGGVWSPDVFEPVEGRSRWDYANERLRTRLAALDCSALGELRVTQWWAGDPAYEFGNDTTIYNSIDVQLAQLSAITNKVEIDVAYRYKRLHHADIKFSWKHPKSSFCNWFRDSSELPDIDMFASAISGSGVVPLSASFTPLPPSAPDPCGMGAAWINNQVGLLLGGIYTAGKRWEQTVTERYKISIITAEGITPERQVISRVGANFNIEPAIEDWPDSLVPMSGMVADAGGDQHDEARRIDAIDCLLVMARAEIVAAHRKTFVSWEAPTSMILNVDLSDTVKLDDQNTLTVAKCSHRVDVLDFETGSATTRMTVSVMRGSEFEATEEEKIEIATPERINAGPLPVVPGWGVTVNLPSQIGGKQSSQPYDELLDGFSGNSSVIYPGSEMYPRRMAVTAPEISEEYTDELEGEIEVKYELDIVNDLLEI